MKELKAKLSAVLKRAADIDAAVKAEAREYTADENESIIAAAAEANQIRADIAKAEEAEKARLAAAASLKEAQEYQARGNGRQSAHGGNVTISDTKLLLEDDPKKGFKNHAHFLKDVMAFERGGRVTNREGLNLLKVGATAGSDEHGVYSDSRGGFLVPAGLAPGVLSRSVDYPQISTKQIPMDVPSVTFNARVDNDHSSSVSGGFRVYRRAETQTVTASRTQFEQVTLKAEELMGVTYATEEILRFSPSSFMAIIDQGFGAEFASKLNYERLWGTGVGQYSGMLTSANGALITVTAETGQDAATLVYENVVNMRSRIYGYSQAEWWTTQDMIPQLAKLAISLGVSAVPVFVPGGDAKPDTLLGRPIRYSDDFKAPGTLGDIALINGQEYLEGTLVPLESGESIHVRFLENETAFKFWTMNAGAPWWRAVLTPKNSLATRSPFVTLEARA